MNRHGHDDGVAVVMALALVTLLSVVAVAAGGAFAVVNAHRRAQSASDLVALAAAGVLQRGGDPCARAGALAARNGAAVESCVVDGATVQITVVVTLPQSLGSRELRARSRAGPVG